MTDIQFVIVYSTILVLALLGGRAVDRLIREGWTHRFMARRRIVAVQPMVPPVELTSPLLARADGLVDQILALYREAAAQGYFLELRVGGFDPDDIETMKLPLVRVNWRRASVTDMDGKRVNVNPVQPGK